jgi:hypothetical protein
MKKLGAMIIALALLFSMTGFASADHGINATPETQGIVTSTSVNIVGNFASMTELQWRTTAAPGGLPGVPPLTAASIYESTYTEDTQTHGLGLLLYDKEMDVETSGQISGQWNIEATKQIAFIGIDGAYIVSTDNIMVDGAAMPELTKDLVICPFASTVTTTFPAYCNRAQAGSTIDMTVANVRTTTTDRFVMPSADHPVELNHDLRVTELVADVPSIGFASAYLDVLIQEGSKAQPANMTERIEFHEETSVDGVITLFDKLMHYESGMVR